MVVKSFVGIGDFLFDDDIYKLLLKIKGQKYTEGRRRELGSVKRTVNITDYGLYVVFNDEQGSSIEYFEVKQKGKLIFKGIKLFKSKISELTSQNQKIAYDINVKYLSASYQQAIKPHSC